MENQKDIIKYEYGPKAVNSDYLLWTEKASNTNVNDLNQERSVFK